MCSDRVAGIFQGWATPLIIWLARLFSAKHNFANCPCGTNAASSWSSLPDFAAFQAYLKSHTFFWRQNDIQMAADRAVLSPSMSMFGNFTGSTLARMPVASPVMI